MRDSLGDTSRALVEFPATVATVESQRQDRAAPRVTRERLQELRRRLQPTHGVEFQLRVRCGHCPNRRVLDEIVVAHDLHNDRYALVSMLPTSARPGSAYGPGTRVADHDGNVLPGGITRPSVTRAKGGFGTPESKVQGHDVWTYECHKRCGATHTFNEESLLRFYLRAFAEGRTELIAGVDL